VIIHEKLGQQAAQVAIQYLSGTLLLTEEPTRVYPAFHPLFDWQQLMKWEVDPRILPGNTVFLNYVPTIWETHRQLIILTVLFVIVLIILVIMLSILYRKKVKISMKLNQSELALRKNRDRLANIIKGTNVGTWEVDPQAGMLSINDRWAGMLGYTVDELNPCTYETWRQLVHPKDLSAAETQIQEIILDEKEFFEAQFRMLHKNGDWVWIRSCGKVISRDSEGNPLSISGTHADITESKRLEEQIIASKKMYQSIVDTQQEMVIRFSPDTTLNFVNDAYCRTFGKKRTELLGKKYLMFIPEEYRAEEQRSLKGISLDNASVSKEYKLTLPDGSICWQEWTDIALFNEAGEIREIQGVGRDITQRKLAQQKLLQAYDATIEGWAKALELKDGETEHHSQRVVELTLRIAEKFGITGEDLVNIRRGALLHDIGKMGIPDRLLLKPGKLTDEEWEFMRKHPVFAFEMLSTIEYLHQALDIPFSHHEKWDGSGYPNGLKGEHIPIGARIFAVVDVYDALTSDRPYRKAWTIESALMHIKEQSGKHFDPQVVDMFLKVNAETLCDSNFEPLVNVLTCVSAPSPEKHPNSRFWNSNGHYDLH